MHSPRNLFAAAKALSEDLRSKVGPPDEGLASISQSVVPMSIVRGTRGYIESVTNQINGCYEHGWFDACAVLVRRLLETLLIESFETYNLSGKIKNSQGDFVYLKELIGIAMNEPAWNLGRNCKQALGKLKDIGDKSAHSRRFVAQKKDLEPILMDIRTAVQELVFLARLK